MRRAEGETPNYPDYYMMCRRVLEDTSRAFIRGEALAREYEGALLDMATAIDAFIAENDLPDAWEKSESRMKKRYMDAYDKLIMGGGG